MLGSCWRIDNGGVELGRRGNPAKDVDVLAQLQTIEDEQRQRPSVTIAGPWETDDIVLPVMEQLALPKGLIPVVHLGAIFAWRDATAAMLSAVTGPTRK